MPEDHEKLPSEVRMKLREAEKFGKRRYPNWKKGVCYGLLGLFSAIMVLPVAYLATLNYNAVGLIYYSSGIVIGVAAIAFVFGAFRPPR